MQERQESDESIELHESRVFEISLDKGMKIACSIKTKKHKINTERNTKLRKAKSKDNNGWQWRERMKKKRNDKCCTVTDEKGGKKSKDKEGVKDWKEV